MKCSVCYQDITESKRCRHTEGMVLPAPPTFVVPENEATQSSYVGGTRRVEAQTDDSEPVMKTAFAYGPAGPTGPQGPAGPVGARGADGKDGKDCDPREVFKQAQAALETTYLDHLKAMREYFDKRLHAEVTDYI